MKRKELFFLGLAPLMLAACQQSADGADSSSESAASSLESDVEIYSYGVGYQIGSQMVKAPIEMDRNGLILGIQDALAKNEPQVEQQRLQEVATRIQSDLKARQSAENEALSEKNAEAAKAFLEANGGKDGVVTLDSGLQYRVLTAGDGAKPGAEDTVLVHYRGTLIDGTEFDSSYSRGEPASFPVSAVIQGWQSALQLMPVGSKWEVVIPPELAYGSGGQGPIPPSSALIFEMELLEIKSAG